MSIPTDDSPRPCEDRNAQCGYWAAIGECQASDVSSRARRSSSVPQEEPRGAHGFVSLSGSPMKGFLLKQKVVEAY